MNKIGGQNKKVSRKAGFSVPNKVYGYAEFYDGELVIGRLGLKIHNSKQGMKNEGFPNDEIAYVEVKVIKTY